MQGKGLVKFFLAAMILVTIYQLSFTLVASRESKKADEAAQAAVDPTLKGQARTEAISTAKSDYLAQNADKIVYNIGIAKYNYDDVQKRAINLGLDLQGGMSVVMEVSKYDLMKQLTSDPKNQKFIKALDQARLQEAQGQGDLIELFADNYLTANPGAQLVTLFANSSNVDDLPRNSDNDAVISWLKKSADDGVESTYTKLKERIDKFGVTQPYVTLQKSTGRIMVELPGVDNPKRARELLQSTANLQFWGVWRYEEVGGAINQANNVLTQLEDIEAPVSGDTGVTENTSPVDSPAVAATTPAGDDSLAANDDTLLADNEEAQTEDLGPLSSLLLERSDPAAIGMVAEDDTFKLMNYFRMEEVANVFPEGTKFMLSAKPAKGSRNYDVYAIKSNGDDDQPLLDGSVVKNASPDRDQVQNIVISLSMNTEGAQIWKKVTEANVGNFIAIALDNKVYSAPRVNEAIPSGRSSISGSFTAEEAQDLSNILEVGKLPVPSRIVQEESVGPSLGAESIRVGLLSMIAGLILVIIFMVIYYSTAGMIADIALFANIFFIFGALASMGATLTLPGIAGLVLTMGMAVDANVIIYERIREELDKGKSMIKAVADGYSGSYSAIIDGNLTTLIIAIILMNFGTGPVKGFAVVLTIGIIASLFTSILISRLIIDAMVKKDRPVKYYTSFTKHAFKNVKWNLMGNRRKGYLFSGALTIIGVIVMFTSGFNFGVDFKGGRTYTVRFEESIDADKVRNELADFDPGVQVKTFSSSDKLKITTGYMIENPDPGTDTIVAQELYKQLAGLYHNVDYKTWDSDFKESQMKVEPTIATDIQTSALKAIGLALIAIFIYIVFRFRRWQFGVGAIASLVHDAFMVLAFFSILKNVMPFSLEINETFIAAILTVIGYSINDTVVVFDRIREYLRESKAGSVQQIFNTAINNTLSRTVITSGTTLLSILVLLIFGNENIQGFAFALFVGIGFGTYSSIFVASAIALDMYKKEDHHKSAEEIMN
ncbi:MAG TPA: protein translocase subunit SecDF [Chitinophagales bacterium]|nr:protein translocase subunit SecDF [Chitinophagales bacterium]